MGINMMSKGVKNVLAAINDTGFDDIRILSLSYNCYTDKKAAPINYIDRPGKIFSAKEKISPETLIKI